MQVEGSEEGHDVSALALEDALALAHDVHVVEHVEQLGGRRVHAADDGAATARQHLEQLDALGGGQVVQARGGLVQEDDGWVVDQLLGDGQPLPLAARQTRSQRVAGLGEAQHVQDLLDLWRRHRIKTAITAGWRLGWRRQRPAGRQPIRPRHHCVAAGRVSVVVRASLTAFDG